MSKSQPGTRKEEQEARGRAFAGTSQAGGSRAPPEEGKAGQARGIKCIKWPTLLVEGVHHKTDASELL